MPTDGFPPTSPTESLSMKAYGLLLGAIAFATLLASIPTAAIALAVAAAIAFLIDRAVAFSVCILNRLARRCRESLARETNGVGQPPEFEEQSVKLAEALARLRRREDQLVLAYDIRRCSQAELVLASSMRLHAEIALLRHRHMPKPFSQASRFGG